MYLQKLRNGQRTNEIRLKANKKKENKKRKINK